MITISKAEYDKIHNDYKGIFHDYHGDRPEWKGRRTVMSTCITHNPNEICSLLIEGVHFAIKE
jgi:hypothetical protein